MKILEVVDYQFANPFGECKVSAKVEIGASHYERLQAGEKLESLPHRVLNETSCMRQAAAHFYLMQYRPLLYGKTQLVPEQIDAIRFLMELNMQEFASFVGMKKGSLSNIMKKRRLMKSSTQLLIMDRLGMELLTPGLAQDLMHGRKFSAIQEENLMRKL